MPRVPGERSSDDSTVRRVEHTSPDQGAQGRRILPDKPGGWAKLIAAVAGLIAATSVALPAIVEALIKAFS